MTLALRVRLGLLVLLAVGLLGTIVVISYRTTERFVAAGDEAARTSRILLQLEHTLSAIQDAETGQRGFLLTGDERYLAPYTEALARIAAQRDQLAWLVARQPADRERVAAVRYEIDAKLSELAEAIQAYRERGPEAARAIVRTDRGRLIMDSLRTLIGSIEVERQERLRAATAELRTGAAGTLATTVGLGSLALLLLAAVSVLGVRYIRERLRAEAALRAESAALEGSVDRLSTDLGRRMSEIEALLDVLPVGIALAEGPDCRRLRVNAAFADMHGMGRAAEGTWVAPPPNRATRSGVPVPAERLPLARAASTGRAVQGEEYELTAEGEVRHLLVYAAPLLDEGGGSRGAVGAFLDITARKHAETERQHAQQLLAIGQLAGGVAHDFNNLLTAISGYASLLLAGLAPDDSRRGDVGGIQEAAARAAALTQQLLAFGRKQVMQPTVLDLREVLDDTGRLLGRLIGEHIDLSIVAGPLLGAVFADRGQLSQVLVNLALNARDAMPAGGRLTIEARDTPLTEEYADSHLAVTPGPYVMIAVSDTGQGMTPEVQARIFEPFFTTKPRGKGTGLGLSTVFGIVKQLGGHIFVYSEPGHGSTFKVYFPRAESAGGADLAGEPSDLWAGGTETVLVVEDDGAIRGLVRKVLETAGYTVMDAGAPREALDLARQHDGPIQLLLTDVILPELTGRDLADRLVRDRPDLVVLFMSGYADDAIVHQGRLDPDTAFLQKPFTPEALLRRVGEVLGRGGAGAAAALR